jgi:RES domain-containing protein
MVGYRLVRERRAADAFSGEGARRYGGRWNPKNSPAVYGSEHLSLAVLEFRVNQGGYDPDDGYVYFRFEFDAALIESIESPPERWLERFKGDGSITASQGFGKEWLIQKRSAVLSVPSSVIRIERNFVLNPLHADFAKIELKPAAKLDLDKRLWNTADPSQAKVA